MSINVRKLRAKNVYVLNLRTGNLVFNRESRINSKKDYKYLIIIVMIIFVNPYLRYYLFTCMM